MSPMGFVPVPFPVEAAVDGPAVLGIEVDGFLGGDEEGEENEEERG